jgi:hypothetical protein
MRPFFSGDRYYCSLIKLITQSIINNVSGSSEVEKFQLKQKLNGQADGVYKINKNINRPKQHITFRLCLRHFSGPEKCAAMRRGNGATMT